MTTLPPFGRLNDFDSPPFFVSLANFFQARQIYWLPWVYGAIGAQFFNTTGGIGRAFFAIKKL